MTTTSEHTPTEAVAEHKPVLPTTATTVAPWLAAMPPAARAIAEQEAQERAARELQLRAMSSAERAALAQQERDERAAEARAELRAARAAQRWSMWCHQVPALYVDDRADCDVRRPETYAWWLSRLSEGQHAEEIAAWLNARDSRTLWLIGPTGTGKTHAAISAGYAAAAAAVHARFVSQLDYLQQLRPGVSDNPTRVRERFVTTSLLVLDDFGAEIDGASQFVRQEMLTLLDERISQGRKQIITTNADADVLADTFGDRIMDRLRADAAVLKYEGASRRLGRSAW